MRIVVEHKDGRRVQIEEADIDAPIHNPFNHPRGIIEMDENTGARQRGVIAGRDAADQVSLRAEGFLPVMAVHGEEHTDDCSEFCPGAGCEVALPRGVKENR